MNTKTQTADASQNREDIKDVWLRTVSPRPIKKRKLIKAQPEIEAQGKPEHSPLPWNAYGEYVWDANGNEVHLYPLADYEEVKQ